VNQNKAEQSQEMCARRSSTADLQDYDDDMWLVPGALLYIEPEFGLEERPILEGAVVAASLVGAAVSTGLAGPGADRCLQYINLTIHRA
jgi:hypothetical protein